MISCNRLNNKDQKKKSISTKNKIFDLLDRSYNHFPLNSKEHQQIKQLKKKFNSNWQNFDENHLQIISKWARKNNIHQPRRIFYPFSGPDINHPLALFPYFNEITMIALEPFGTLDFIENISALDSDKVKHKQYINKIQNIYLSIHKVLSRNFFKTNNMKIHINNEAGTGVANVLTVFLALHGYSITNYNYLKFNQEGALKPIKNAQDAIGIRLYAVDNQNDKKEIIYLSVNLADKYLKRIPGLEVWLRNLKPGFTTLLKSASYLMHYNTFDDIRSMILSKSSFIYTDASGIPFHFFENNKNWKYRFFGTYLRPVQLFQEEFQPDLFIAFIKNKPPLLPFNFGYVFKSGYCHIIEIQRESDYKIPKFDFSATWGINTEWNNNQQIIKKRFPSELLRY